MRGVLSRKADEPTRRLIASAPRDGVLIYIKPVVNGATSGETSRRVAQFKAGANTALTAVRATLKDLGVKPVEENEFWVAAHLTKRVAQQLASCPHVASLREDPTIYGYSTGRLQY